MVQITGSCILLLPTEEDKLSGDKLLRACPPRLVEPGGGNALQAPRKPGAPNSCRRVVVFFFLPASTLVLTAAFIVIAHGLMGPFLIKKLTNHQTDIVSPDQITS
jgi:hypothetical protein